MHEQRFSGLSKNEIQHLVGEYRSMIKEFTALTSVFPEPEYSGIPQYRYVRLPRSSLFVDSPEIPLSFRRLCIQALIDHAQHLIDIRPRSKAHARVIAEIDLPRLSNSGIIIFFEPGYLDKCECFRPDLKNQGWTPLSSCRGLEKEWIVSIPDKLSVTGYQEEIRDDNEVYTREFWFVGELS